MSHPAIQLLQEEFQSTAPTAASPGFLGKKRAAARLQLVAKALGPEKTRSDLIPVITELILASREEDEILYEISLQLDKNMLPLLGGGSHGLLLVPPLEIIANFEETIIREKAVESLACICSTLSKSEVVDTFVPFLKRNAEGEWFTGRSSSAGLIPYVFAKCQQADQEALLEIFGKLMGDETPMVRKQVAKSIATFLSECPHEFSKSTLHEQLINWYKTLTQDAQKSVRVATLDVTSAVCKVLSDNDVLLSIIPLVKQFASERSWRVRDIIAEQIFTIIENKKATHESLLPTILDLLQDGQEEVRTTTIKNLPRAYKALGRQSFISNILPSLKALGNGENGELPLSYRLALVEVSLLLVDDDPDGAFKEVFKGIWDKYLSDTISQGHADARKAIIQGLSKVIKALGGDFTTSGGGWGRVLRELFENSKNFQRSNSTVGEPQPSEMEEVDTPKWRVRVAIVQNLDVLAKVGATSNLAAPPTASRLSLSSKKPPAVDGKEFAIDIWKRALSDEVSDVRNAAADVLKEFLKSGSGFGGSSAVESLLVPYLKDYAQKSRSSSFQHRIAFLRCCATVKDIPSIWGKLEEDFVTMMLKDPVPNVRIAACRIAWHVPAVKAKLQEVATKDEDSDVRECAKKPPIG